MLRRAAGTLPSPPLLSGSGLPAANRCLHLCSVPHGYQACAWHCVALEKVCLTQHGATNGRCWIRNACVILCESPSMTLIAISIRR